jgi:hypothetical protein
MVYTGSMVQRTSFPFIITLTPTACSHSYTKYCPSFFISPSVVVSHNDLSLHPNFFLFPARFFHPCFRITPFSFLPFIFFFLPWRFRHHISSRKLGFPLSFLTLTFSLLTHLYAPIYTCHTPEFLYPPRSSLGPLHKCKHDSRTLSPLAVNILIRSTPSFSYTQSTFVVSCLIERSLVKCIFQTCSGRTRSSCPR